MATQSITDDELRTAYQRAGLARLGISYQHAIDNAAIRLSLWALATEIRRRLARRATPAPYQPALI